MAPKRVTIRTAERMHRASYDYYHLADNLIGEGFESEGNAIRDIARNLGKIGRSLESSLNERN